MYACIASSEVGVVYANIDALQIVKLVYCMQVLMYACFASSEVVVVNT